MSMKYLALTLFLILSAMSGTFVKAAIANDKKDAVSTKETVSIKNALSIQVLELTKAPSVDGDLGDWPSLDTPLWQHLQVQPALKNDPKNLTGNRGVLLAVGVFGERIFLGARWPDLSESTDFKVWKWRNKKYKRGKQRDDMFAVRFFLDGNYDTCMLPERDATYQVDVWLWSAGRSNLASMAEDMVHTISDQFIENAAEYPLSDHRTIYIKKRRDSGDNFYKLARPDRKVFQGKTLPGALLSGKGSGSLIDVSAVGQWENGYWSLEMSRKRVTGHADDVAFLPGRIIPGGVAVFNKGSAEHKSVEGNLVFDLSRIKK